MDLTDEEARARWIPPWELNCAELAMGPVLVEILEAVPEPAFGDGWMCEVDFERAVEAALPQRTERQRARERLRIINDAVQAGIILREWRLDQGTTCAAVAEAFYCTPARKRRYENRYKWAEKNCPEELR